MVLTAMDRDEDRRRLEKLVEAHRKRKDERLHLAVWFHPRGGRRNIYLLEVLQNFGGSSIDENGQLFHIGFGSASGFPLEPGRELRLVLTNPEELREAVASQWKSLMPIRVAKRTGMTRVLFADGIGRRLWERLT